MLKNLNISDETLRYQDREARVSSSDSDTLFRFAALYAKAENVLDGVDQTRQWMGEPNFSLGDMAPVVCARTWIGARAVEDLLGQIEHGVSA